MLWIDLEMTGLKLNRDKIIEIACLLTDEELNIISQGPCLIVHQVVTTNSTRNCWIIWTIGALKRIRILD